MESRWYQQQCSRFAEVHEALVLGKLAHCWAIATLQYGCTLFVCGAFKAIGTNTNSELITLDAKTGLYDVEVCVTLVLFS